MAKANLQSLIKRRSCMKSQMSAFLNYVDGVKKTDINPEVLTELETRIQLSKKWYEEFNRLQSDIEDKAQSDLLNEHLQERTVIEGSYIKAISQAQHLINTHKQTSPVLPNSGSSCLPESQNVKLPTIQLPTFDGNDRHWMEFRDTYNSLIHENPSISEIQKFHYLRAALKDGASQVISAIEFSAMNYQIAWQTLFDRYNNDTLLINNHVAAILDLKCLVKPTAEALKNFLDVVSKHLRALSVLKEPVERWDTLLIHIITRKLDFQTIKEWEEHKIGKPKPVWGDMKKFLGDRANMLEALERNESYSNNSGKINSKFNGHKRVFLIAQNEKCTICHKNHAFFKCPQFLEMQPKDRYQKALALNLCLNCLKNGHSARECQSGHCKKCNKRHNSLLHGANERTTGSQEGNGSLAPVQKSGTEEPTTPGISAHFANSSLQEIILPTVLVSVSTENGKSVIARALLDSGSQGTFITEELAKSLDATPQKIHMNISGLGSHNSAVTGRLTVSIASLRGSYRTHAHCLVIPKITGLLPSKNVSTETRGIPDFELADPSFNKPGGIDILIGSDLFWRIMTPGIRHFKNKGLTLKNTVFGWTVSGPVQNYPQYICQAKLNCHLTKATEIQEQLKRFWEVEELGSPRALSPDELACENNFQLTTVRETDGRFRVRLPFKHEPHLLGTSEHVARRQFLALEKRLLRNEKLRKYYTEFLREYEALGHMKRVAEGPEFSEPSYYLPHHGVLKEESSTTKLRVVFNGSQVTTSGYALNDMLHVGPTIQDDLLSIMFRFRRHQIAIVADIKKMYRQVNVDDRDTRFQRIFWRESPGEELKVYELKTVTYGTSPGSFLATRCLKQLALENQHIHPEASEVIKSDFYVDDLLTGADDQRSAMAVCENVRKILAQGKFELQKWRTNDSKLINALPTEFSFDEFHLGRHEKTLGILWSAQTDSLSFTMPKYQTSSQEVTKRSVLSLISRIFDPLGLLSPCTLYATVLLQKLWLANISWDDDIPEDARRVWDRYLAKLPVLNEIRVPRRVIAPNAMDIQFHGFADASQTAYGGCVYLRCENQQGEVSVHLVGAKGKVAPLKPLTIPKLELLGAHLVSKLVNKARRAMRLESVRCTFWTDSTIVLGWLKLPPNQLKTFVSNRVTQIQEITGKDQWRHISSDLNPADQLTRGVLPEILEQSETWWKGPKFLSQNSANWPKSKIGGMKELPEVKNQLNALLATEEEGFEFQRFSSLVKLKRTVAYILRFKHNCQFKKGVAGPLTVDEINRAFLCLVKVVQGRSFKVEIKALKGGKDVEKSSNILKLSPFLDNGGILRVGGRLKNSNYEYNKLHPILLPANHHVTKLVFRHEHLRLYHAGPSSLLASTRETIWVPSGLKVAKAAVRACVQCVKYSPRSTNPIMGELPPSRVNPGFPFQATGVDYAGPYEIKWHKGRGAKTYKAWICLFICFKTHAIHLELVTSLSSEGFIAAFRRFTARRGKPQEIYSDNGTNFAGANVELKRLLKQEAFKNELIDKSAAEGVKWNFIPPRSPHMGGIWERGIRSCKHHLQRILGNQILTYEEFHTVLIQIESILNSRPLTPLSANPNDLQALTPYHFLLGHSITSVPDPDLTHLKLNSLSRYQHLQFIQQHFWKRWQKEYIGNLQQRTKWKTNQGNLKVDDMVVVKDDRLPPKAWSLGRVTQLHPGRDGVVRVVDIRTPAGVIRRCTSQICALPTSPEVA